MTEKTVTLKAKDNQELSIFPNIKRENIPVDILNKINTASSINNMLMPEVDANTILPQYGGTGFTIYNHIIKLLNGPAGVNAIKCGMIVCGYDKNTFTQILAVKNELYIRHCDLDIYGEWYKIGTEKNTNTYSMLVNNKVRERYSLSEELAILRQKDIKQNEFLDYNNYVELCKNKAKEELYLIDANEV